MNRLTALLFSLGWATALAGSACHTASEDVAPTQERAAQAGPSQAMTITIDADGLTRAQIQALAEHIEGIGEIASAKIRVEQDDAGATSVVVEVAGSDLPSADELRQEVLTFDGLADAAVVVQSVHPDSVAVDPVYGDVEGKSPEQIKAEVISRLRAEGVQGDIIVDVIDDGNGERKVLVSVEHDEESNPSPAQ